MEDGVRADTAKEVDVEAREEEVRFPTNVDQRVGLKTRDRAEERNDWTVQVQTALEWTHKAVVVPSTLWLQVDPLDRNVAPDF